MINRRDALKTIAGTALIPVVGITPAVAAVPEQFNTLVSASWREGDNPFVTDVLLKFNIDPQSPYIESAFNSMLKMYPKAEEIVIMVKGKRDVKFKKEAGCDLSWGIYIGEIHA